MPDRFSQVSNIAPYPYPQPTQKHAPDFPSRANPTSLRLPGNEAPHSTSHIHRESNLLATILPNTIIILPLHSGLKELRNRVLTRPIPIRIPAIRALLILTRVLIPKIGPATKDSTAFRGAGHVERVAVHERHVAVGGARVREEAFEFGAIVGSD